LGQFPPANSGIVFRKSGTDAQISLESRDLDCCGFVPLLTLDQESPGSSPGGAMAGATAPAFLFWALGLLRWRKVIP
jgi:hypothetical protein